MFTLKLLKIKLKIYDLLYMVIGIPWLFLMIMSPRLFSGQKKILLLILFILAFMEIFLGHKGIKKNLFLYTVVFVSYFMLSLLWGIFKGYEFKITKDFALLQYYLFTPVCVVFLGTVFGVDRCRREFIWTLVKWITLFLAVLDVLKIIIYRINPSVQLLKFIMISSSQSDTNLTLRVSNEISFMFLLPIFMVLLFDGRERKTKEFVIYGIIVIFGTLYSLLSGRKMLELILIFCMILTLVGRVFILNKSSKTWRAMVKKGLKICLILCSFYVLLMFVSDQLRVGNIMDKAINTLESGLSSSAYGVTKRVADIQALMDLWLNSPLIGNGLNSYAKLNIASSMTKWSYEVVYHALLAQTGIIGVSIFAVGVIYNIRCLWNNFRITGDDRFLGLLLGFVSFVISGASNPLVYLVWPWALVLIYGDDVEGDKERGVNT